MTALVLTNKISQSSQKNVNFSTIKTQFGDGYEQRATDGINPKRESWRLVFENLTSAERTTLWNFIDTVEMQGVIEWTADGDSTEKKWVIDSEQEINENVKAGDVYTVSFTIKRVFDL